MFPTSPGPSTNSSTVGRYPKLAYEYLERITDAHCYFLVDDGFLNMMTMDGTPKDDVKLPEGEVGDLIQKNFDDGTDLLITIISAMGEELAIACKEAPRG